MAKKKVKGSSGQQAAVPSTGLVGKLHELREFFEESKVEIKKVVWPSRKETIATCIAVVAVTVVVSLYLGVVDLAWGKLVEAILS